jgi:phage regulator Rha-like protein
MGEIISYKEVEEKILSLRGQSVILDSDVAELYGVETREINQAVKNNPAKFPEGYIFDLTSDEVQSLRSKNLILKSSGRGQHTKYLPSAFTEKGLYMLATILKSPKAAQTTIAIVETFTKIRELSRTASQLSEVTEKDRQKTLMQKSGEILADIIGDNILEVTDDETTIELNLALVKFKRTIKRGKKPRRDDKKERDD